MNKPDFDTFRAVFLECLLQHISPATLDSTTARWDEVGSLDLRHKILASVNTRLQDSYGISFDINHRLLNVNGPVESAIIQAYHELNTIYLMERINDKIRKKLN